MPALQAGSKIALTPSRQNTCTVKIGNVIRYNLRIFAGIFQPKSGRKLTRFSLGGKTIFLRKKSIPHSNLQ